MENNSKPILTDRQKVQQDLFMDGLVHFLEIAGRIQDAVVRKELKGMQTIHLAFLRRASVHGYVSFDRIRADTGLPRYAISRAGAYLAKKGFGKVRGLEKNKQYRRFDINDEGQKVIGRIDLEIAKSLLYLIGATGHDSKRYYLFTVHLHNLARFLPASRARSDSPSTDVQAGETVSPEEAEVQGLMEAIAAEPRLCMASSYRDIFGRF